MGETQHLYEQASFAHAVEEVFFMTQAEQQSTMNKLVVSELADEFGEHLLPIVRPVLLLSWCQFISHGLDKDKAARALFAMQRGIFTQAADGRINETWKARHDLGWEGFPTRPGDGRVYSAFMWQVLDTHLIQLGMMNYNRRYDYAADEIIGTDTFGGTEWRDSNPTWPAVTTVYHTVQLYGRLAVAAGSARGSKEHIPDGGTQS